MPNILKQDSLLIATLDSDLVDSGWHEFQTQLLAKVRKLQIRDVILDVTAMDTMDSYATRMLRTIAAALSLLGAKSVVVGIQPAVALAMAQLGLRLEGSMVALDLDEGLSLIRESSKVRR